MDIKETLLADYSKTTMLKVVTWVGQDIDRFHQLTEQAFSPIYRVAQRSSWAMIFCVENHPDLLLPYLPKFIEVLQNPNTGETVKRNIVRMITVIDIPEEHCGTLYDLCFRFFKNLKEAIAVRVFSMTVMANISLRFPELIPEVEMMIQANMPPDAPASLTARGKHELNRLKKANSAKKRRT
ncbi:MAG: hypothetical protein K1X82_12950 [Bacteroidia bacterium]|nr:hypothetical protein [Bacteroidia bacterium]